MPPSKPRILDDLCYPKKSGGKYIAFTDTLVGTDSHTTTINGLTW
ncbi:MAG: hypothetical protein QXF85_02545 [Candidatus Micrarchaeaceae archaeon]